MLTGRFLVFLTALLGCHGFLFTPPALVKAIPPPAFAHQLDLPERSRSLSRLFDDLNEDFFGRSWLTPFDWQKRLTDIRFPDTASSFRVDVTEDEKSYIIKADVPGVKKEDIDVSFKDGVLSITAQRKEEKEEKEKNKYISEVSYGSIFRSFRLPPNVDPDSVQASYENGVLKVVVDKTAPSALEKKIEIK